MSLTDKPTDTAGGRQTVAQYREGTCANIPFAGRKLRAWQEVREMVLVGEVAPASSPSPGEIDQAHTRCMNAERRIHTPYLHKHTPALGFHTCSFEHYPQHNTQQKKKNF